MSSIASASILPIGTLATVAAAATPRKSFFGLGPKKDVFEQTLKKSAISSKDFEYSGYVLATAIPFLSERGYKFDATENQQVVSHMSSARSAFFTVLTSNDRERHLTSLKGENYTDEQLRAYFEEFNQSQAPGVEIPMRAAIEFIISALQSTSEKNIVLLRIG